MSSVRDTSYNKLSKQAELIEEEMESEDEQEEEAAGWQRLIPAFANAPDKFMLSFTTSLRVAVGTTVYACAALYVQRHVLANAGFDSATILCNALFTVGADLGQTMANMFYGTIGIFWGWFAFWLYFGIFPHGYTGSAHTDAAWWVALFVIATFTFTFLVLNVDANVRFWALLTFTGGYAMDLLNPNTDSSNYSVNFTFNYRGQAENSFILFLLGGLVAISLFVLPFHKPLTSLAKMRLRVCQMSHGLTDLHYRVHKYYLGPCRTLEVANLRSEFQDLVAKLRRAEFHGSNAWYESVGRSKSRLMTNTLVKLADGMVDRFEAILGVVVEEDFGSSHFTMMNSVKPQIEELREGIQALLFSVEDATLDGVLDKDEKDKMKELIARMPVLVEDLQTRVHQISKQFGNEPVNKTLLGEHTFLYSTCRMAQVLLTDAKEVMQEYKVPPVGDMIKDHFKKLVTVSPDDWTWAFRTFIAMSINFLIGWIGWCDDEDIGEFKTMITNSTAAANFLISGGSSPTCFITPYNAGLANINVVLLSKLSGATFKNALDRMSAVVLASVVGQLGYVILGWCDIKYRIMTAVAVFFITWGFMYANYFGGLPAGVGQRLAAMTVYAIMVPCSNKSGTYMSYSNSYHAATYIVMGVIVMLVVDMVIPDKNSNSSALASQEEAVETFRDIFRDWMENRKTHIEILEELKQIRDTLTSAKTFGDDAANEPAGYKAPWNAPFFSAVNTSYSNFCMMMTNLVNVVEDDKAILLDSLPAFQLLKQEMFYSLDYTSSLSRDALSEDLADFKNTLKTQTKPGGLQTIDKLISDMNRQTSEKDVWGFVGDFKLLNSSRRCVIVLTFESLINAFNDLQTKISQTKKLD